MEAEAEPSQTEARRRFSSLASKFLPFFELNLNTSLYSIEFCPKRQLKKICIKRQFVDVVVPQATLVQISFRPLFSRRFGCVVRQMVWALLVAAAFDDLFISE